MSKCKNNIISNSSFSWWAAWLNENKNKTVIAPSKWFKKDIKHDIIPESWVKL
ncbi:alpha-1,2-fucosyltransferase [Escherichia coli]|nr:alpha-1,2-fucosyltransferase [Escherichia coli]EHC0071351.1 alpha-1,2-fucosyltransferase [Escherichia coli]EHX89847.1 putative fucosyltransferase domain protein [Escherichia coli DEC14B]EJA1469174.1 alpha-1,2-fucosyltransferase [Escherichia coli]MCF6531284.1 alpha-1,2-fucosyltransferase [Escherichia coli]